MERSHVCFQNLKQNPVSLYLHPQGIPELLVYCIFKNKYLRCIESGNLSSINIFIIMIHACWWNRDTSIISLPWRSCFITFTEQVVWWFIPSPCANESGVQFPLLAVYCVIMVSQSMLALTGFLMDLRFPPAFKIMTLCCMLCWCLDPFWNKSHDLQGYPWCKPK